MDKDKNTKKYYEPSCFLCRGTGRDFNSPDNFCVQCNGWGFISDDELYEYISPEEESNRQWINKGRE